MSESGLLLPDTTALPDLAEILSTTVDAILAGGDCPRRFQRRIRVEQVREALCCIQRLRDILGKEHFMYRVMTDALDARMNSSIELAFQHAGALDAYICEALLTCLEQGDYVDRDDVRTHVHNPAAAHAVLARLDELGIK